MRTLDAIAIAYLAASLAASLAIMTVWNGWAESHWPVLVFVMFFWALFAALPGWALLKFGLQRLWPRRLQAGPVGVALDAVLHASMGAQKAAIASLMLGNGVSDYRLALPGSVAGLTAFAVERLLHVAYPSPIQRSA